MHSERSWKKFHFNGGRRCSGLPVFCPLLYSSLSPYALWKTAQSAYHQRKLSRRFKCLICVKRMTWRLKGNWASMLESKVTSRRIFGWVPYHGTCYPDSSTFSKHQIHNQHPTLINNLGSAGLECAVWYGILSSRYYRDIILSVQHRLPRADSESPQTEIAARSNGRHSWNKVLILYSNLIMRRAEISSQVF